MSGGVRSSTSRTNPGRGIWVRSPLVSLGLWRERHLERAELPRRHRVVDRIAPPIQRVGGPDESVQDRQVLGGADRQIERGLARPVREGLGAARVRAEEFELAE